MVATGAPSTSKVKDKSIKSKSNGLVPPKKVATVESTSKSVTTQTIGTPSTMSTTPNTVLDGPREQSQLIEVKNGTSTIIYDVEHLATFSTLCNPEKETNSSALKAKLNENGNLANAQTPRETSRGDLGGTDYEIKRANDVAANSSLKARSSEDFKEESPLVATATTKTPIEALQRLFTLEKLSGIWTQRMQIQLEGDFMIIRDCETNSVVEKFERNCVTKPEAFNEYNHIYNNIVVFIIRQREKQPTEDTDRLGKENQSSFSNPNDNDKSLRKEGEIHIFQCVSHKAQRLVSDIVDWKRQEPEGKPSDSNMKTQDQVSRVTKELQDPSAAKSNPQANKQDLSTSKKLKDIAEPQLASTDGQSSSISDKPVVTMAFSQSSNNDNVPIANVNVKETVQVFNQIAALREKRPNSPPSSRPISDGSMASNSASTAAGTSSISSYNNGAGNCNNEMQQNPLANAAGFLGSNSSSKCSSSGSGSGSGSTSAGQQAFLKQPSIRASLAPRGSNEPTSADQSLSTPPNRAGNSSASSSHSATEQIGAMKHNYGNTGGSSTNNGKLHSSNVNQQCPPIADELAGRPHQVSAQSGNQPQGSAKAASSKLQQQRKGPELAESTRMHTSASSTAHQFDQVTTNESYVSVLNHCFDDIEKFIIRLQQAVVAHRELQAKRKLAKRTSGSQALTRMSNNQQPVTAAELAILSTRAKGPSEDDFFEILSKFKLAFNLLAKLKGCIHEPNAPELVHFLFTPLSIIVESARNASPPVDLALVGIPYLNQSAIDLLSNCCTSKESDLWISLGPNWTRTIDLNLLKASRLPSSFQPIFSDGWAPIICELELIGLVDPHVLEVDGLTEAHSTLDEPQKVSANGSNEPLGRISDARRASYLLDIVPDANEFVGLGKERPDRNQQGAGLARRRNEMMSQKSSAPAEPMPYGSVEDNIRIKGHHRDAMYNDPSNGSSSSRNQPRRGLGPGRASSKQRHNDLVMQQAVVHNHLESSQYPAMSPPHDREPLDYLDEGYLPQMPGSYNNENSSISTRHSSSRGGPRDHPRDHWGSNSRDPYYYRDEMPLELGHTAYSKQHQRNPYFEPSETINEVDHETMLLDLGSAQIEWFYELQSRGAMIVRVLFTRFANNDKELSVRRGELLEIVDDSRKWWRARNIDLQIGFVPHTIVAPMYKYQTVDELVAKSTSDLSFDSEHQVVSQQQFNRRSFEPRSQGDQWSERDHKRNSRNSGAFRYF